jgi:hypothetical protein
MPSETARPSRTPFARLAAAHKTVVAVALAALVAPLVAQEPTDEPGTGTPRDAGRFESPRGYSFAIPDGWTAFSRHLGGTDTAQATRLREAGLDLERDDVCLIGPHGSDLAGPPRTIHVAIQEGRLDATERDPGLADRLRAAHEEHGLTVDSLDVETGVLDNRPAYFVTLRLTLPGEDIALVQKTVLAPFGTETIVVTASGRASAFDEWDPAFREVLDSMALHPLDWLPLVRTIALIALFAGIVGMAIQAARNRRRAGREAEDDDVADEPASA